MLRSSIIYLFIILSLALAPGASADIYKYVDDYGVIHFSNVPYSEKPERVIKENAATSGQVPAYTGIASKPETVKPGEPKRAKRAPAAETKPGAAKAAYVPSQSLTGCEPYADLINSKCDKYGVDRDLVKSIIKAESNFNPRAVSNKGARGLMQLMPSTASDMGVSDMFDPDQNIDGGVKYLKYLLDNFGGDVELSVAAYNCGQGRVIRNGNCVPNIPETKNYVKKVLKLSKNPITGMNFTRPIYRIEMKDGSILFSDSPASGGRVSLVD